LRLSCGKVSFTNFLYIFYNERNAHKETTAGSYVH
jgi:hypothetical protein